MKTTTFEQRLWDSHEMLFSKAFKLFNDREKAEDLVQETLYKGLAHQDKFVDNTNLEGWLYTILKNLFINQYNKNSRHQTYYTDTYHDSFLSSTNRISSNKGISNITMDELKEVIKGTDEKFTKPFMMHYEGYKYEEIAEELDLPIGTIKTRIHKARKLMQDQLKDLYPTY